MRSRIHLYELWCELPFRMQRDEISKSKSPDCAQVSRSLGEHTRAELKELVAHSENQLIHRVAQVVRLEHAERDRRGAEVPEGDGHVVMQKAGSKHCRLCRGMRKRVKRSASSASWTYQCPNNKVNKVGDQRQDCRDFKDHLNDRSDGDVG